MKPLVLFRLVTLEKMARTPKVRAILFMNLMVCSGPGFNHQLKMDN